MNKLNKSFKISALMLAICSMAITGCKKDKDDVVTPTAPNENELITTFQIVMQEVGNPSATPLKFVWKDMDGELAGKASSWDTLRLKANTKYTTQIIILDETKSPADSISNEVFNEGDEHQFFFTPSGVALEITYKDEDENKVPIGLTTEIATKAAGKGTLNIVLKHQPDVKPKSGNGDVTKGSTDINLAFVVEVTGGALIVEAK